MQITKIITDETLRELRKHGTDRFPFQYNFEELKKFDEEKIEWHWHTEFEFVKVIQGTAYCLIGNTRIRLNQGDGIFINSRILHSLENYGNAVTSNILFSSALIAAEHSLIHEKYIKEILERDSSHIVLHSNVSWQATALNSLDEIFSLCKNHGALNQLSIHIKICKLWMLIFEHQEESVRMDKFGGSIRSQSRLRRMMNYIGMNYYEKIYLDDIARSANISKSEASRCFQMGVQMSPIEYLNLYRLHRAKIELETTEDTIMHIAISTGFISSSYFSRIFKKVYGITPKDARNGTKIISQIK